MPPQVPTLLLDQTATTAYFDCTKTIDLDKNKIAQHCLNIAIVSETWPPEINGVSFSMLQLAKGLQKRGHKILLIRPQQKTRSHDFIPDMECLVKSQSIPKYRQLQFGLPQVFKIGQAFDQFKPDIVHIVTEGPLGLAALNQAKLRQIPISSGFHSAFHDFSRHFDLAFLLKPLQQYLRWFHNNTDLTCVPSQFTLDQLQTFGVKCAMRVIGRGVDASRFNANYRSETLRKQWQADQETTVLLSVGRVSPEKELPVIFSAFHQLKRTQKNRKFVLVVVGDGPILATYQQDYPDVIFMGAQTGEALSQCYASADVFVFPSQVETFGNVVLEAMASSLPVLAYNYACAGQMLEQAQAGWLVPLGECNLWQQKLLQLPELKTLRQMGELAAKKAQDKGWEKPVTDFEQALSQFAKKPMVYARM
ncbi:glycosyltransferase family 1 protein [Acinetobacter puyangensis]|uniref:Uncharacterized protein n=1 Tax=Acinetobacter puyangensis TaxID=1096779 RepID=A0A240E4U1_9GAMM|nr:glycosyltransferase family 1 protein [Acinetobacter puyangensis]SNX43219.1 hypothetical protein SAMN05421731_101254 [Acinetobacter puyangensis]